MNEKVQAAHVQGKYTLKQTIITGIFGLLIAGITALVPALISANHENSQLKKENESLIQESKAYVEQVQDNDNDYQAEIDNLKAENDSLKAQVADYQNAMDDLETKKKNAEEELSKVKEKESELEQENAALTEEKEELQSKYENAEKELEALKQSLETGSTQTEESDSGSEEEWIDFYQAFNPYEHHRYEEVDKVTMMGNTYRFAAKIRFGYSGYAWYNLDEKYTTLEFDIGHIDGSDIENASFSIRLDGQFAQEVYLTPDMNITHVVVPLNNAKKLVFEWGGQTIYPEYGLINMKIR